MPVRLTQEQASHLHAVCRNNEANMAKVRAMPLPEADSRQPWLVAEMTLGLLDVLDERDALLDILERLHSVQDGCPLHKYNTVWVKAMEDAQAAFDRAGGGA